MTAGIAFAVLLVGTVFTGVRYPDMLVVPLIVGLLAGTLRVAHDLAETRNPRGRKLMLRWVAIGCGAICVPYLLWYAHRHRIDPGFFTAVAQVIPVLLVAVLVDVSRSDARHTRPLVWVIGYAFVGEGLALSSEAVPRSVGVLGFAITASTVITLAFALIFTILWRSSESDDAPAEGAPCTDNSPASSPSP
jgi:hypothetical protein